MFLSQQNGKKGEKGLQRGKTISRDALFRKWHHFYKPLKKEIMTSM